MSVEIPTGSERIARRAFRVLGFIQDRIAAPRGKRTTIEIQFTEQPGRVSLTGTIRVKAWPWCELVPSVGTASRTRESLLLAAMPA